MPRVASGGANLGSTLDRPYEVPIEFFQVIGWNPVFLVNSGAHGLDLVAVEEGLFNVKSLASRLGG
jgi:hypothetical protein